MASFQYGGIIETISTTVTAAGTSTLTNVSSQIQVYTGSSTQTVVLPNATTYTQPGAKFEIVNESSGSLTLQFNGGGAFTDAAGVSYTTIAPHTTIIVKLQTNGTSAGTWLVSSIQGVAVLPTIANNTVLGNQSGGSATATAITAAQVAAILAAFLPPTGSVIPYAGSSAPTGYLLTDGSAISRTTFATLFGVIGTTYGVGDGSTTFNLPNTKGVFLRGAGSQTISAITYTGTQGISQNDATKKNGLSLTDPGHNHIQNPHNHRINIDQGGSGTPGFFNAAVVNDNRPAGNFYDNAILENTTPTNQSSTTGITLNSSDTETRPANITVNYIIKT